MLFDELREQPLEIGIDIIQLRQPEAPSGAGRWHATPQTPPSRRLCGIGPRSFRSGSSSTRRQLQVLQFRSGDREEFAHAVGDAGHPHSYGMRVGAQEHQPDIYRLGAKPIRAYCTTL